MKEYLVGKFNGKKIDGKFVTYFVDIQIVSAEEMQKAEELYDKQNKCSYCGICIGEIDRQMKELKMDRLVADMLFRVELGENANER